jgi:hypothetical protein
LADQFLSNHLFAVGTESTLPSRERPLPVDEDSAVRREGSAERRAREIELRHRKIMAQYFDLIPAAPRAELLRYQTRRWHLLNVFAKCPGAVDLSRNNPALLYALASNWVFHKPAVKSPLRAARGLVNKKQRDILKWLRFPHDESVRKILSRVVPESLNVVNLLALRQAVRRRKPVKLLAHVRRINTGVIRLVCQVDYEDYLTTQLLNDVGQDREQDARFAPVVITLRDTLRMIYETDGAAEHPQAFASLRRLKAEHDQRAREYGDNFRIAFADPWEPLRFSKMFPEPPFAGNENIVPIRTPFELRAEGEDMHNCVFSYVNRIAEGQEYAYRVLAPFRGTLSLLKRDRRWVPGQLVWVCNKMAPDEIRQQVYRELLDTPRGAAVTAKEFLANPKAPNAQPQRATKCMERHEVPWDAKEALQWFRRSADMGAML